MRTTLTAIIPLLAFIAFEIPSGGLRPPLAKTVAATTADPAPDEAKQLDSQFRDTVLPFINTYCAGCHGKDKPKGDVHLTAFTTVESDAKEHRQGVSVLEQLKTEAMPPVTAKKHPKPAERKAVIEWIESLLQYEAKRTAGDPGHVPPRRLSNAEYDYTIPDLT